MSYKLMFSLPVHERTEVVLDQIINFSVLNPASAIVLHLSKGFNYDNSEISKEEFLEIVCSFDNVFVNPNSLRTALLDIIQAHLSNFEFVKKIVDFDYFCLSASNEVFVKHGLDKQIENYDCGVGLTQYNLNSGLVADWPQLPHALNDESLKAMLRKWNTDVFYSGQVEGTFYKKELFSDICDTINQYYDYTQMKDAYAREEVYFSTLAYYFANEKSYKILKNGYYTFVPWERKDYDVNIKDIDGIIGFEKSPFYSVKRVDRILNTTIRMYLRNYYEYYEREKQFLKDSVITDTLSQLKKNNKAEVRGKAKAEKRRCQKERRRKLKKRIITAIRR